MEGFWRIPTKLTGIRDQVTAQVRDEYLRLDDKQKQVFREWVNRLVSAGDVPVHGTGLNMGLQIYLNVQGLQERERLSASPNTFAAALAAWDKGEEYIHNSIEF